MKVVTQVTSPSERVLEIRVDAAEVEKAFSQAFAEKRKNLRIKGFRKGNVPDNLAKQYLNDAQLVRRVVNMLVPPAYKEALKQEKLAPLGKPDWELIQAERGKDLTFRATLHVMPILDIKGYKNFPVPRPAEPVKEEQVEATLQQRRQSAAVYQTLPEDRQARLGDFAFLDYRATHRGNPLPQGDIKNFLLEMKQEKFLPGFVDKMVGIKAQEERSFELTLPMNYADRKLAGEPVKFEVKVHQLKERLVPDLDDHFARRYTKSKDLATLRENIRANLEMQQAKRYEDEITNTIVKSLVSHIAPETVPAQLREGHAQLAWRTHSKSLERQGITMEQYLTSRSISSEHFAEELRLTGLVEARLEILYRSIAAAENVVVLKKEVDQAITAQANTTGATPALLKEQMLKDDTYKLLAYRILISKVRKRLFELADFIGEEGPAAGGPAAGRSATEKPAAKKSAAKSAAKSKSKAKSKAKAEAETKAKAKSKSEPKAKAKAKSKSKSKAAAKAKAETKPKAASKAKADTDTKAKSKAKAKASKKSAKQTAAKAATKPQSKTKAKAKSKKTAKAKTRAKSKA